MTATITNNIKVKNYNNYILYIGKNDKDSHAQKISDSDFIGIITSELIFHGIEGATFEDTTGVYLGEVEKSLKVSIIDFENNIKDKTIIDIADALRVSLNQNEILIQKTIFTSL